MTPLRRRLRRLRRVTVYGIALLIIIAGLLVAIASRLLPLVRNHPDDIAQWLSERSGKAVSFRLGDAEWTRRGPLISLHDLRVGEGDGAIEVGRAQLLINVYAGMLPGRPLTELHLRELDLQLREDADGRWSLGGIGSGAGGDGLRSLQGLGEIRVDAAKLSVSSALTDREFELDRIDARLLALGGTVRFGVSAYRGGGLPLRMAGELDATLSRGVIYAGGDSLDLISWVADQPLEGVSLTAGVARIGIWTHIDDRRIESVQVSAALDQLMLIPSDSQLPQMRSASESSQPTTPADAVAKSPVDSILIEARWERMGAGWRLDVPALTLLSGKDQFEVQSIRVSNQSDLRIQLGHMDLQPVARLAALTTAVPATVRRWLGASRPGGALNDLSVTCDEPRGCRGQLQVSALHSLQWRRIPGVEGLTGTLFFEPDGATFRATDNAFGFDARGLIRGAQRITMSGDVGLWRSEAGWRVGSDSLAISATDFAVRSKGWIEFQDDGSRPRADIYAETAPAPLSAAGQFWVPRKMPKKVIDWLDNALVSGHTGRGQLVVQGDFDEWPFRSASEGRFEALVELDDVQLDYQPGKWPEARHLSGTARFVNQGMTVEATAEINGIRVTRVNGTLEDFRHARLLVDVSADGHGEQLLDLLRNSPLQSRYGEQLVGVSVGGRGQVGLKLDLPLEPDQHDYHVNGKVDLSQSDLTDTKWGLLFGSATGRIQFSSEGFLAQELRVSYRNQPASLSIAVGAFTSTEDRAVEATLRGRFDADGLLAQNNSTLWMQPYVQGAADFSLLLSVPSGTIDATRSGGTVGSAPAARLRVRSDLNGVAILLPAPLRKVADASLPLDLRMDLPSTRLDLMLGGLMQLQGTMPESGGLDAAIVFGGGEIPADVGSLKGLHVSGSVPVLDAAGWAAFSTRIGSGVGLQSLDLETGQLDLLGRSFADVGVEVVTENTADTRIRFDGAALAGELEIPGNNLTSMGITARFKRLYWPSTDVTQLNPLLENLAPSMIPPLHFSVDDLHFGDARLGETRLETYPTPEGLHVEQFESHSDDLRMSASGDWRLLAGSEQSSFHFTFTSEDVSKMLESLGFASIIEGGQSLVDLTARWTGSPAAFELANMQGKLSLSVGEGRIPELEPGAGRLLGLVSLTEIPRRLSLDFSDFFRQGFSFNAIDGEFQLEDGNALTDDLHIDSPAADIHISGRTGLAARDYDQKMEVLPRTSSVLPVVGALAAGPAGAAIGAVAQAVLQRPMKQMGRTLYHVGGSWDDPLIETLEKGPARDSSRRAKSTRTEPESTAPEPVGQMPTEEPIGPAADSE